MPANAAAGRAAVLAQYEDFALQARSAAAAETLGNVRDKHLTSALTWDHLAASARKMETLRVRRMAEQLSSGEALNASAADPVERASRGGATYPSNRLAVGKRILIG